MNHQFLRRVLVYDQVLPSREEENRTIGQVDSRMSGSGKLSQQVEGVEELFLELIGNGSARLVS